MREIRSYDPGGTTYRSILEHLGEVHRKIGVPTYSYALRLLDIENGASIVVERQMLLSSDRYQEIADTGTDVQSWWNDLLKHFRASRGSPQENGCSYLLLRVAVARYCKWSEHHCGKADVVVD